MDNDRIGPICYVRHKVSDLAPAATLLEEVVGLRRTGEGADEIRLRADARDHAVSLVTEGTTGIGIEVDSEDALQRALCSFRDRGLDARLATPAECERRSARAACLATDHTGNAIDLLYRPFVRGSRFFPSRDSGIEGLKNVGMRSTDIGRDVAIWTEILGARISDWVGDVTYLRIGNEHHSVALYPSVRAGIVHLTFAVDDYDNLMRNYHHLKSRQIEIAQGPGRETVSGQRFVRFRGPEGMIVGFGQGMAPHDDMSRPRQFTFAASSLCDLGSEAIGIPELATAA